MSTYKLKRKKADGTLEDVILQGVGSGGGVDYNQVEISYEDVSDVEYDDDTVYWDTELILRNTTDSSAVSKPINIQLPILAGNGIEFNSNEDRTRLIISATGGGGSCVITDLGQQDGHGSFQEIVIELLKPTSVPNGKYLYTYWTECNADATLAIAYKNDNGIYCTQYTSKGQFRKFFYDNIANGVIEQQCLTEMGVELAHTLGNSETQAMSQAGVTQAVAKMGGIPFVTLSYTSGGTNYTPAEWHTSNVNGITEPTDGMTIAVRTQNAGYGYGIVLSIDGGNKYYPIVRNKDTRVNSEYPKGSTLILTFNSTQTVSVYSGSSTMTTVTGCWQIADYNTDTIWQYTTTDDGKFPLLFKYVEGNTSLNSYTQFNNNIYVNPSTGTIYANDFVVDGQSIVGGGGAYTKQEGTTTLKQGTTDTLTLDLTKPSDLAELYIYKSSGAIPNLAIESLSASYNVLDTVECLQTLNITNPSTNTSVVIGTTTTQLSLIIKPNGNTFDLYYQYYNGNISSLVFAKSMQSGSAIRLRPLDTSSGWGASINCEWTVNMYQSKVYKNTAQ